MLFLVLSGKYPRCLVAACGNSPKVSMASLCTAGPARRSILNIRGRAKTQLQPLRSYPSCHVFPEMTEASSAQTVIEASRRSPVADALATAFVLQEVSTCSSELGLIAEGRHSSLPRPRSTKRNSCLHGTSQLSASRVQEIRTCVQRSSCPCHKPKNLEIGT